MGPMTDTSFTQAVAEFVAASPWLGPQDAPALVSLRAMATRLDNGGMTPALLSQYGLAYRSLLKRAPSEAPAQDEFERLLAQGSEAEAEDDFAS